MKKIFLFLSLIMLMVSTVSMAFPDVGHKDIHKIEIAKDVSVLEQAATISTVNFEALNALDVGWQNSYLALDTVVITKELKICNTGSINEEPTITQNFITTYNVTKPIDNYLYSNKYSSIYNFKIKARYKFNSFRCVSST